MTAMNIDAFIRGEPLNADIGHPKLFIGGKASAATSLAVADCE
jgi:hypothetical protein